MTPPRARGGSLIDGGEVVTKHAPRPVGEVLARLLEILAAKDLRVFAVIDQGAAARAAGLALRDTVLVIFGDPRAGTPVMSASPLAALDLPLKVLLWDDEGRTAITYQSPHSLVTRYGVDEGLSAHLDGIHALTDALVAST